MTKDKVTCVLTIAGSDSSGGAGIQADIKAISATGCYAASVITALTAQNTQGVQAIQEVSPEFVAQQIESVFSDLKISAVKIGMLHNEKIISVVAAAIEKFKPSHIVLDPVIAAKNGSVLLASDAMDVMREKLFPLVTLITPNLIEAEIMMEEKINNLTEMESLAIKMGNTFNTNILLKGGHLNSQQSPDVLYSYQDTACHWFHVERIHTLNTHGTGCSLSSAISSYLAQGETLPNAVNFAKQYLTKAIQFGSMLKMGHGFGPVDHFYFLKEGNYNILVKT